MKTSKLYTCAVAVLSALVLFTGSVAVPILCRPFYYLHISLLNLQQETGLTWQEIRTAYDEMMDYCLGGSTFSTGVLVWSESGKAHFDDVRTLFILDLQVLAVAAVALAAVVILARYKKYAAARLLGHGPTFWGPVGLGGVFLAAGCFAATDFHRAFVLFHTLFFPGKDNWLFDPQTDAIINILPEAYFRNCAILILAVLVAGCIALIVGDFVAGKTEKTANLS